LILPFVFDLEIEIFWLFPKKTGNFQRQIQKQKEGSNFNVGIANPVIM